MSEKPRVRYIEFMGHPSGSAGIVVFSDQHKQQMGSFPLKRFGLEVLHDKIGDWLGKTDPVEQFKQIMDEVEMEEIEIKPAEENP
jgi:hypothetical protein